MRTRVDIEREITMASFDLKVIYREVATLEVLLDIRDLLQAKNTQ